MTQVRRGEKDSSRGRLTKIHTLWKKREKKKAWSYHTLHSKIRGNMCFIVSEQDKTKCDGHSGQDPQGPAPGRDVRKGIRVQGYCRALPHLCAVLGFRASGHNFMKAESLHLIVYGQLDKVCIKN